MAKKSKIARNDQRKVIVERYAAKRLELKKALVDPAGTDETREAARLGLQKLPRNASPVRLRNRDSIDGRPRGVLSKFGVSRVRFRDMAHRGELPGITKSQLVARSRSAKRGGRASAPPFSVKSQCFPRIRRTGPISPEIPGSAGSFKAVPGEQPRNRIAVPPHRASTALLNALGPRRTPMADTLNKTDLVAAIAAASGQSQAAVGGVVDSFFDVVAKAVASGTKVSIPGWISFERTNRAARAGRNPATGATIQIAASKGVKVSAGSKLKAAAKNS